MVGRHHLEIENKRIKYVFDIERKVTVIKGKSGTGKTTLIRMLSGYISQGNKSGITMRNQTNIPIKVFDSATRWESELKDRASKLIFVDEATDYIYSKAFQEEFAQSVHYLVVISRSGRFNHLPFAIDSIYELRTEEAKDKLKLTKMYHIYEYKDKSVDPDTVITEDSNSGAEMMDEIFESNIIPAHGNGSIANVLAKQIKSVGTIFIVVDGAAFGGFIARVMSMISLNDHVELLAPESFEYMLLQTEAYKRRLDDQLENTWKYCDISRYLTWEQYYTDLLKAVCEEEYGFKYTKIHLHHSFTSQDCERQVKEFLLQNCVAKEM